MSTTDSDSSSDAGKKRKHASESHKIKLDGNSYENKNERELAKKKETKKRKTKEDVQTTQNNDFKCVNGKEDVDVDGDVIRKKLKKKKKRRLERDVEQLTANDKESCERKHKKARVDPPMDSHNVERKKKKKKKKHKNEKSSLDFSEKFALQKNKHKPKSEEKYYHVGTENIHSCLEPSILDSPDYTNSINNDSSSLSSADKERQHKKKKKKKERERERNRTFIPRIEPSENADKRNDDKGLKEAIKQANAIHETWILSKEQLNSLKEKGIKVKSGKWSSKEFNLLHANMDKFLKNHGLANPSDILFHSSMDKEDRRYWRRFALQNNFYKCLGEGIQRSLKSIYRCALRIFDSSNYKGKYADEEVEELRRLHEIHGKNWVSIGQLMGRSNMSVCRKFSTLPTKKGSTRSGNWGDDEVQCLKEAVHLVTNTPEDQQVPFDGIYWAAVARMVKTRSQEQCRRKWLERICWTENVFEKNWTKEDDNTLITRLYNSGITEEWDVDWMEVKTEFETNYSPQFLRKKWSAIKKKVPDYHQLDFEEIVDYLYQEYSKTKKD